MVHDVSPLGQAGLPWACNPVNVEEDSTEGAAMRREPAGRDHGEAAARRRHS